jgi:aryl-alcohol dehydrogenase-like predicted oxidoreductase
VQGTSISKLALQFSSQRPEIPTTLFSTANLESVQRNVEWHEEPFDPALLNQISEILSPVFNRQWTN